MSIIIGLKHKGSVFLACDALITSGSLKYYAQDNKSLKIRMVSENPLVLIGNSGNGKYSQTNDLLKEVFSTYDENIHQPYRFIVENVYPAMINLQREHRIKSEKDYPQLLGGSRIIAFANNLFVIDEDDDGAISQVGEFSAIGSSSTIALGSLMETRECPPLERIERALMACEEYDTSVSAPFYIYSGEDKGVYKLTPAHTHEIMELDEGGRHL